MNKVAFFLSIFTFCVGLNAQKTVVDGVVTEQANKNPIVSVKVSFYGSKISTLTDSLGRYHLETYYPVDSIQFYYLGFKTVRRKIKLDQTQVIDVSLRPVSKDFKEIVVLPPDEFPSTKLHKKIIAHKPVNNKEKLMAYQYEAYNKIQVDINNLGDEFTRLGPVKKLDVVLDYLDTADDKSVILPAVLTESVSDFYFANKPSRKREIVKASRITGVENLQAAQFLGDMYLDINVYDNVIDLFGKSFISPIANYARSMYKFYLDDSTYIGNKFCYKMRFVPKRDGDLTFFGEMWVHDTTYAILSIKANISPGANLNYIQDLYFEQEFDAIENEVWMLTKEKLILDLRLADKTKMYGFYGRKSSSRRNFVVNKIKSDEFYNGANSVEFLDGSKDRTENEWATYRHDTLNKTEIGIAEMIDTLNRTRYFRGLRTFTYFVGTGYYPFGKIEFGNVNSLVSTNPVEEVRFSLAMRTSNAFSKKIELGGKVGYGLGDEKFKYSALIRYNITPKKRGMWSTYFTYDLEQIGQSPTAALLGNTFATVLNTAPFDKLTFVKKIGSNLEKDIRKDLIILMGFDWKEFTPLGISTYVKWNSNTNAFDTLSALRTSEFIARIRWTKDEEFLSGQFDRTSVGSAYPILSLQGIFGVKGIGGSMYNYQKIEFQMEHYTQLGVLGRLRYGVSAGYVFGSTAFPFLKAHEGNQSYWLLLNSYNKLNFLEFVSDKYISAFAENHWEGLFFNQLPGIKKLNLRWVTTERVLYGGISSRHQQHVAIPNYVRSFGKTPYVELSIGLENIFKVVRVDLVWRATHNIPGESPLGVRARFSLNF